MLIHHEPLYTIYFGDTADHMYPKHYLQWHAGILFEQPQIRAMAHKLQLDSLMFLSQIHGKDGIVITKQGLQTMHPFSVKGDFLVTSDVRLGLGIMSADCLPVIFYDKRYHVAGIAHAGWRGAVGGVVTTMLETMRDQFGTKLENLTIFYGPSAKQCCYRVGDTFMSNLDQYYFAHEMLQRHEGVSYFDLPGFVQQQLLLDGIDEWQIRLEYNDCTICDHRFCSSRRETLEGDSQAVRRQMTVIVLK